MGGKVVAVDGVDAEPILDDTADGTRVSSDSGAGRPGLLTALPTAGIENEMRVDADDALPATEAAGEAAPPLSEAASPPEEPAAASLEPFGCDPDIYHFTYRDMSGGSVASALSKADWDIAIVSALQLFVISYSQLLPVLDSASRRWC